MKSYLIAVSYASEQRYYVEKFVNYFKRKNISIYYDRYEQKEMVGKLLHEKLQKIYTDETKFRIIFLSKNYTNKPITQAESEYILADNIYNKNKLYIFKFDDSNLPGLNRNFVYSSISEFPDPSSYARFIYSVIENNEISSSDNKNDFYFNLKNNIFQRYNDFHNINILIDERGNNNALCIKKEDDTLLYLKVETSNENTTKLWVYPYEPFDKNLSYNGYFISDNSKSMIEYTFYNLGLLNNNKTIIDNLNEREILNLLFSQIKQIVEEKYGLH